MLTERGGGIIIQFQSSEQALKAKVATYSREGMNYLAIYAPNGLSDKMA